MLSAKPERHHASNAGRADKLDEMPNAV